MSNKIKTSIKCTNIAPLRNLDKTFESSSLKIGVFAGNGRGKTYLSRMFRLLEPGLFLESNETNETMCDSYLTFGQTTGDFYFRIIGKDGVTAEESNVRIVKGHKPQMSSSNFIFHVFNQDFVEENISAINFDRDVEIEGYILGKANIDVSGYEKRLANIGEQIDIVKKEIHKEYEHVVSKIGGIRDIKRINEFKTLLSFEQIVSRIDHNKELLNKNLTECLNDYDKLKSVPENIPAIRQLQPVPSYEELFRNICSDLATEYSLSAFSEEFKAGIRRNQQFIEAGVMLYRADSQECPFCKRPLDESSIQLIDRYTSFLNERESQTIKHLQEYVKSVAAIKENIKRLYYDSLKLSKQFDEYKSQYMPSLSGEKLEVCAIDAIMKRCDNVIVLLEQKMTAIDKSLILPDEIKTDFLKLNSMANISILKNNEKILEMNNRLNKITDEMREAKRGVCKAAYNEIIVTQSTNLSKLKSLSEECSKVTEELKATKEKEKISKKKLTANTIKMVLDYFFSGKYSLDENSFKLRFEDKALEKGQVKHVLSEGERTIVAFAYYLGNLHSKMSSREDYKRTFFVIDDPISSLDFTYVYTLSSVIRDIKELLPQIGDVVRMIVLTHNNDFMRILMSNNILDKALVLKNSNLIEYKDNFTIPYVSHLLDVYGIARNGEVPTHTTANSIRHIIETLVKFDSIESSNDAIKNYIKQYFEQEKMTYTYINDMSHGGWRSEQEPIDDDDYRDLCEAVISHIEKIYPNQVTFCKETLG